jgi:hypothetical protein
VLVVPLQQNQSDDVLKTSRHNPHIEGTQTPVLDLGPFLLPLPSYTSLRQLCLAFRFFSLSLPRAFAVASS